MKILIGLLLLSANLFAYNNKKLEKQNITNFGLMGTKVIALTIDDGPTYKSTAGMLKTFREYGVKATFFVNGNFARVNSGLIKEIANDGHLLANHTLTHTRMNTIRSKKKAQNELREVHKYIIPYMSSDDNWFFRAPGGSWSPKSAKRVNKDKELRNYIGPVYWDIGGNTVKSGNTYTRAADWECWSAKMKMTVSECAQGYLNEIRSKKGGVVLLHDLQRQSAEMVAIIVPILIQEGYRFVTLNEVPSLLNRN